MTENNPSALKLIRFKLNNLIKTLFFKNECCIPYMIFIHITKDFKTYPTIKM